MPKAINTKNAPAAIGPYDQANVVNSLVFTSGQLPIDPATGEFVAGGIVQQTERVLDNIMAIVEASGASMEDVVKTTVYVTDLENYAKVNGVYDQYFRGDSLPSRTFVEVSALPKGAQIEIDAVAYLSGHSVVNYY